MKPWRIIAAVGCAFLLLGLSYAGCVEEQISGEAPAAPQIMAGRAEPRQSNLSLQSESYVAGEMAQWDCEWDKGIQINGTYAGEPGEGHFTLSYSDTLTISDSLWCDFEYDWSLVESWEPGILVLNSQSISFSNGGLYSGSGWLEWYGGYVPTGTWVHMEKSFRVQANTWLTTTVSEFADFGPLLWEQPVALLVRYDHATYLPLVVRNP
jgi:hypothetical protein